MLCALFLSGVEFAVEAGETWKDKAYDATYNYSDKMGSGTMRMAADGKGRALVETKRSVNGQPMNSLLVMDANARTCISVSGANGQKIAMKMPFQEPTDVFSNEQIMAKRKAKPIGTKVIDGHPCRGWQYSEAGVNHEDWIADDIKFLVSGTTSGGASGATNMKLKNHVFQAPPASSFVIPADAKVMDMPNFGGSMPQTR